MHEHGAAICDHLLVYTRRAGLEPFAGRSLLEPQDLAVALGWLELSDGSVCSDPTNGTTVASEYGARSQGEADRGVQPGRLVRLANRLVSAKFY